MVELKSLTSYELVETLVASAARPAKDLDRAISNKEAAKLRARANRAGLPIADEYGMSELVFGFTDGIGTWHEDLSEGWEEGFEKRSVMQSAFKDALLIARLMVREKDGLIGWQLEREARRLIDNPGEGEGLSEAFISARDEYQKRRGEYILEFGTVHSHIFARQQQLQVLLDGITKSRDLPRVTLEFRDGRASVADYVRGANVVVLNNADLTMRSRAPFIVSLIAGQLTVSYHDIQIVRALIDRVNGEGQPPPECKKELPAALRAKVIAQYFDLTGGALAGDFLDDVALLRSTVLNAEELERAGALMVAFKATIGMLEAHEMRADAIASFEEQSRKLRTSTEKGSCELISELYDQVTTNTQISRETTKADNPWRKVLNKLQAGTARKKPLEGDLALSVPTETSQAAEPAGSDPEPKIPQKHIDQMSQLCRLIDDGIEALRQQQKEGQDKYLMYVHAREAVVFSKDAYTLALSRLSPKLKYTGPKKKKPRGMEDACVHHDESTYLDVHGM
ncbi:MAG: hypothetical protein K2W95_10505 [Candidatus Obscuribacterales bacterium]|nr:hypothetical protein [Candidatus Obscuribacterales bacterium]